MSKLHPLLLSFALLIGVAASADANTRFRAPKSIDAMLEDPNFARSHPDMRHRLRGQDYYADGQYVLGRGEFLEAARFGDKLSQAMLAEMHWNGRGGLVNRPLAYAWMDLAAERGFVPFIGKRERFWSAMDAAERERSQSVGSDLYAEFGDEVALPRLAKALKRGQANSMVRRAGWNGIGRVVTPTAGMIRPFAGGMVSGGRQVEFDKYHAPEFWRLNRYVDWHARQLDLARRGLVQIGPIELKDSIGSE
jgi:uncharacterized protein